MMDKEHNIWDEHININPDEDIICHEEGMRIFGYLRKKYSNENTRDLDIVLNSICAALIRLARFNVPSEDSRSFIILVSDILSRNLCSKKPNENNMH